ncbi:hypothetical protein D3C73_1072830 [compost metagenome]
MIKIILLSGSFLSSTSFRSISLITSFRAGLTICGSAIFSFLIFALSSSIISIVVSIPISEVISISSNSSYKSSSMVTARFNTSFILSVKLSLVLLKPCFSLSKIPPNTVYPPICLVNLLKLF